jgi:pilus assembly protein Flp/PilA
MWNDFSRFMQLLMTRVALRGEEGQGLIEYALILSLIAVAAIVIMTAVGGSITGIFSSVSGAL